MGSGRYGSRKIVRGEMVICICIRNERREGDSTVGDDGSWKEPKQ